MGNRVSANITIGGGVPADRLEDLATAIEAERLGPDWDGPFEDRSQFLGYLAEGATGANFCAHEVNSGEFSELQQLCVDIGLTYVLTYDGYGGEWGPARRIRRPGDPGDGLTCSLDSDGGRACIAADDIPRLGFADLDAVRQHLQRFDDAEVPPLQIEGVGALATGGGA